MTLRDCGAVISGAIEWVISVGFAVGIRVCLSMDSTWVRELDVILS